LACFDGGTRALALQASRGAWVDISVAAHSFFCVCPPKRFVFRLTTFVSLFGSLERIVELENENKQLAPYKVSICDQYMSTAAIGVDS